MYVLMSVVIQPSWLPNPIKLIIIRLLESGDRPLQHTLTGTYRTARLAYSSKPFGSCALSGPSWSKGLGPREGVKREGRKGSEGRRGKGRR